MSGAAVAAAVQPNKQHDQTFPIHPGSLSRVKTSARRTRRGSVVLVGPLAGWSGGF
jgi:hypothetical protein